MDREVIEQKLESLRRCMRRVVDKCPADQETLERNPDLQDILALNLTRAVQLSVDIDDFTEFARAIASRLPT